MAEDRALSTGEDRCHPPRLFVEAVVPEGIDPLM
jgi:hypothetical protein